MLAMAAAQVRKGLEVARSSELRDLVSCCCVCVCVIFLKIHHTHLLLVGGGGYFVYFVMYHFSS